MTDKRTWAKLDVGYFDNPKVVELAEARPRVVMLHLRAILYSRQHLTDGVVPTRTLARLACADYCGSKCEPHSEPQCDVCEGVQNGLFEWTESGHLAVHDYLSHQDSREQVMRRKDAGQAAASSRWSTNRTTNRHADRIANGTANRNATPNTEREEKRTHTRARARGETEPLIPDMPPAAEDEPSGPTFADFWALYPRRESKGHAEKAWARAAKAADPQVILDALTSQVPVMRQSEKRFIPMPATWLNGRRWENEESEATGGSPPEWNTSWVNGPIFDD